MSDLMPYTCSTAEPSASVRSHPQMAMHSFGSTTGLTNETTRLRFFIPHPHLTPGEVERFTHVDHHEREALVALDGPDLIAVGRFDRLPGTDDAEVAFVVADGWQGQGVGSASARTARASSEDRRHHPVRGGHTRREPPNARGVPPLGADGRIGNPGRRGPRRSGLATRRQIAKAESDPSQGSDLRPCRQRPCRVMMQVHGSRPQRTRSPRPRRVSAPPGLGDARSHRVHVRRAADGVARQLSSRRRAHLGAHRSGQHSSTPRCGTLLLLPSRSTTSIRSITRVGASP